MFNFVLYLLGSTRKRCLSRLMLSGHKMFVILIMVGGF